MRMEGGGEHAKTEGRNIERFKRRGREDTNDKVAKEARGQRSESEGRRVQGN